MDDDKSDRKPVGPSGELAVPSGRLSRFLHLGRAAGSMMASGALEKMRRIPGGTEEALPHVLLTRQSAKALAERLSRLRGAAMKVGQMLSLEGDNLLPKEFAEALEVLRSSAHRMPDQQVRQMLRAEYGEDYLFRFRDLELEPMAAASIGQVHRAVTHQGERIVLKIQYPGVRESIDSDVDNLRSLVGLARLVPRGVDIEVFVEALKAELRREVDYERELEQLGAYRKKVEGDARILVPRPYPEHTTSRILALEEMRAEPLLTWAQGKSQQERNAMGTLLFELLLSELFRFGLSQTDPNPANYQVEPETGRLVLLDFGATRGVEPGVSLLYREAFLGIMDRDQLRLEEVVRRLGVDNPEYPEATRLIVSLALEAAEAFDDEVYDFGATDLQRRLNERAPAMKEFQGKLGAPPPEYVFFQRKLTGTFLLCRNLGARVPCRTLVERALLDRGFSSDEN